MRRPSRDDEEDAALDPFQQCGIQVLPKVGGEMRYIPHRRRPCGHVLVRTGTKLAFAVKWLLFGSIVLVVVL